MGKSLVIAVRSPKEDTKKPAHVHEQSEFTYGAYLVAVGHLYTGSFEIARLACSVLT